MDVAYDYDYIQGDTAIAQGDAAPPQSEEDDGRPRAQSNDLGTEFREAYQAVSNSVWGVRLGGFFDQVKKQGESYYEGARQELSSAGAEASRGWTGLVSQTRSISIGQTTAMPADATSTIATAEPVQEESSTEPATDIPESLPADILKEAETILSRLKVDAAARLKQVQKAEDAADAALERFGTNIKNFLRDAVTISAPSDDDGATQSEVLFESKDAEGKRVVHATRFDAQLHVIHSNPSSFNKDPDSEEYNGWKESFDVEKQTDTIAKHLDKYDDLRRAMDKLVPEQVSYAEFWTRYYFLRHVIETEEQKRRELLKGTQMEEEKVAWDDDDEDEEHQSSTPNAHEMTPKIRAQGSDDAPTPTPAESKDVPAPDLLKPNEPRRSNEQSVADSDASYDIVSGAASRSPGTPKEEKDLSDKKIAAKSPNESDEEDWE